MISLVERLRKGRHHPAALEAASENERLRQEFREIITFAETRRQDGIEMGATVWRIALEDIISDARDALNGGAK